MVAAALDQAPGYECRSNISRGCRLWEGETQRATELLIRGGEQRALPILRAFRVIAILQELGSPLHNPTRDVRVCDCLCPQGHAKNADRIGTKSDRQSVNDDLATSLSPEAFLEYLNLCCTKNASICAEA